MKKLLSVLLLVGSGVGLGVMFHGTTSTAEAGGDENAACSTENGDVNADGQVDLSDAVTILGHLFLGQAPELAPLCEPRDLVQRIEELEDRLETAQDALDACNEELERCRADKSGLPATGSTECYGQFGNLIDCESETCPGQDGRYATGCSDVGRFVDNPDGTVTDNCTGLMWQRETADMNGDGESNQDDFTPWCEALEFCEDLILAGHDDWRLPNIRELLSIADYGRVNPAIDPVFGGLVAYYWSSTTREGRSERAWTGVFSGGGAQHFPKDYLYFVRAVRTIRPDE